MRKKLSKEQLKVWHAFYRMQAGLFLKVEQALHDAGAIPLNWYAVLYALYLSPGRRLKLSELAERTAVRKSSLSRLVDRLEEEKLLQRQICNEDGRCSYAVLTRKGVREMARNWTVYEGVIRDSFFAPLGESDVGDLGRVLSKLSALG